MVSNLVFYQLALIALLWVFLMLSWVWPSEPTAARPMPPTPVPPPRKRSTAPTPFAGLTHTPHCEACAQGVVPRPQAPCPPPPRMVPTRGRPRHVDTSRHFCPHPDCPYRGWVGWGNLSANGLPTICQPSFVNFFTPSARLAHDESGSHHSRYVHAAWPSGYATTGPQDFSKPGHGAAPSPATPHTRC